MSSRQGPWSLCSRSLRNSGKPCWTSGPRGVATEACAIQRATFSGSSRRPSAANSRPRQARRRRRHPIHRHPLHRHRRPSPRARKWRERIWSGCAPSCEVPEHWVFVGCSRGASASRPQRCADLYTQGIAGRSLLASAPCDRLRRCPSRRAPMDRPAIRPANEGLYPGYSRQRVNQAASCCGLLTDSLPFGRRRSRLVQPLASRPWPKIPNRPPCSSISDRCAARCR